jgi:hypothetical protein
MPKKRVVKAKAKEEVSVGEESNEEEFDEIEQEAKMMRDSNSEEEEDATEFMQTGEDLDLPSEDSEIDGDDLDGDDDQDDLDDYYEELGIKHEKDYTGTEELYKK